MTSLRSSLDRCFSSWGRPLTRVLPLLALGANCWAGSPVSAKEANKTICCRSSGGTRGTCLNVWAHLVPPSNSVPLGPQNSIALLQGTSPTPTAMTLQFSSLAGELVSEQTLAPGDVGVRVLTPSATDAAARNQTLVWESFPTCRPNRPPTRSHLLPAGSAEPGSSQAGLPDLRSSCGQMVPTAQLLSAFGLEEFTAMLPSSLPVRCETLILRSLGTRDDKRPKPLLDVGR
ncbi:MAG: hypothetical protein VKO39_07225 [Cyanobacteriota bacterium]|nr:hypothetical protein [Cyanobacteriota bacterium]